MIKKSVLFAACSTATLAMSGPSLAQATSSPSTGQATAAQGPATVSNDEITVTAQKRSETLLKVPASINAITGERLKDLRVSTLADLANFVPGLAVTDGGAPGSRIVEIRGLSTGYHPESGPLVGTYIDDLPVGDSTNIAHGGQYGLDLNPYDVERVEVLKGPQGTLYGANTMGGLVKYVTKKPDLAKFQAEAGADVSTTDGSGKPNWQFRGAVNVPIVADKLAISVSGFDKYSAGYIDNVVTGAHNVNHSKEWAGRGTILWQVNDRLSVRGTVLAQNVNAADMTAVTIDSSTGKPLNGPNTVNTFFPQPDKQQTRIYSAAVDWDLNFATLTSSTGWSRLRTEQNMDYTGGFGAYVPGHPDALVNFFRQEFSSKFVEELRLTSPSAQRFQWMLGGYYTKEHGNDNQFAPSFTRDYVSLGAAGNLLSYLSSGTYQEIAGFGNATFKFSDHFDISGGVRYSSYKISACTDGADGLFGPGYTLGCNSLPSTGVAVWMGNVRYHLNDDMMFYFRAASGYRPGSGCPTCGNALLGVPGIVKPDRTVNYEGGFKGSFFDRKLNIEVSAFHVDWNDIQITSLTAQGLQYAGNAGTAVSNGFELTTGYKIMEGLLLNATVGYTDAHLTEDAPGAGGKSGDQLPGSPRWTASVTADYQHPLDDSKTLLAGASYRYRGSVVNQFAHTSNPFPIGPQNLVDLYAGLRISKATMRLYATNIFNKRAYAGLLYAVDSQHPEYVPVQPRTVGLSLDYAF